jgi:hypothetical protein
MTETGSLSQAEVHGTDAVAAVGANGATVATLATVPFVARGVGASPAAAGLPTQTSVAAPAAVQGIRVRVEALTAATRTRAHLTAAATVLLIDLGIAAATGATGASEGTDGATIPAVGLVREDAGAAAVATRGR